MAEDLKEGLVAEQNIFTEQRTVRELMKRQLYWPTSLIDDCFVLVTRFTFVAFNK